MSVPDASRVKPSVNLTQQIGTVSGGTVIGMQVGTYVGVYVLGAASTPAPAPRRRDVSPYKFLDSYTFDEQDIFFGREALCARLCGSLLSHDRTCLVGAAAIGKSSLVHAGLIPALARDQALAFSVRDYSSPFAGVRAGLQGALSQNPDLHVTLSPEETFAALVSSWIAQTARPAVIFFDQFERLFALPVQQQDDFARELLAAQHQNPERFHVVLVLRQGFEALTAALGARLGQPNLLGDLQVIPGLDRDEARRAILGPLHVEGELDRAKVEDGLIDDWILPALDQLDRSKDGRVEPGPLQIVCSRLFQQAQAAAGTGAQPLFSIKLYRDLGECSGILQGYLTGQKDALGASDADWTVIRKLLNAMAASDSLPFYPVVELARQVGQPEPTVRGWLDRLAARGLVQVRADSAYALIGNYTVDEIRAWFPEQYNADAANDALRRALADWDDQQLLTERTRLKRIQGARSLLQPEPRALALMLRSAVAFEAEPNFWLAEISRDAPTLQAVRNLAEGEVAEPITHEVAAVLFGPDAAGQIRTLGEAAVRSQVENVRITAALALAALGAEKVLESLRPFFKSRSAADRQAAVTDIAWVRLLGAGGDWSLFVSPRAVTFIVPLLRLRANRTKLVSVAASAMVGTILIGLVLALAHIGVVLTVGLPNVAVEFLSSLAVGVAFGGIVGALYGLGDVIASPRRRRQQAAVRTAAVLAGFALANWFVISAGAPERAEVGPSPILIGLVVGVGFAAANEWALERRPGRRWTRVWLGAAGLAASAGLAALIGVTVFLVWQLPLDQRVFWDFAAGLNSLTFMARLGDTLAALAAWVVANMVSGGIMGAGLAGGLAIGDWLAAELERARYV